MVSIEKSNIKVSQNEVGLKGKIQKGELTQPLDLELKLYNHLRAT